MENGAFTSCGFDKKSSSNSGFVSSMNSISTQVPPSINNLGRSFVDGGGCSSLGPTTNSGGANDVYRENVSSSSRGGATNLQAFHIFPSSYYTVPFKSPGGEMGFPFTAAQWKELERQAMIYKCMVSSVPVPPHLLSPLSTNSSVSSLYSSGRYARNGDPEPGRCKRTDGKKWRCAREVAPHQKYCERHLHRGRPRSRKPVELKNDTHKKQTKSQPSVPATEQQPLIFFNTKTDLSISSPYYKPPNRELGMTVTEGEMVSPWENMIEPNLSLENCYFPQQYVEQQPLNLFSYPDFPAPEIDLPSGFIDAWSIDNLNTRNNEPTISLNEGGDLSPSLNLSMAMAAGNIVDREMRNIQNDHKTKDSIWLTPVSWEPFAGGGPLGEALQPVGGSNPSTPATTVSSPSGVLHWTLFSQSDSSVCNSPTFVAPPSEVSNQWLNWN